MLEAGIIKPVEESERVSLMVVQDKKIGKIRIYVDLRKLNDACVHDLFPTLLIDGVLENVEGQEAYSFTNGFSWFHHINIALEDMHKTTLVTEWGSFHYIVMPFSLKNEPTVFFKVVITYFKYFIHKFLEVYLDDWTVFSLLKKHIEFLCPALDRNRQLQILLNVKKGILCSPIGIFLGHVLCKKGYWLVMLSF